MARVATRSGWALQRITGSCASQPGPTDNSNPQQLCIARKAPNCFSQPCSSPAVATTVHNCTHPLLLHLCLAGLLVPDLPLEETDAIRAACEKAGLELVLLTTPTTPQSRMADIARASQGFVYLVSVTGEAGAAAIQPGRSGWAYAGTPGRGAVVAVQTTLNAALT